MPRSHHVTFRAAVLVALTVVTAGCVVYAPTNLGLPSPSTLTEVEVVEAAGYFTDAKILLIPISGTISGGQDFGPLGRGRNMVADVTRRLEQARLDNDVKAIVLTIDSPGGGVTASDQIYRELDRFRKRTGKPIIASLGDVAASGGYYVAMAADEVVAHPTTVTGSIGVITEFMSVEGLLDKVGVSETIIKSGEYKDSGSPYRTMTDAEKEIYQDIVDALYARFLEVIRAGRPNLTDEQLGSMADGRVFTAQAAKNGGLVDAVGYLDDAIQRAKDAARLPDANIVVYRLGGGSPLNLFGATAEELPAPQASATTNVDLGLDRLLPPPGGRFLYLWDP